MQNSSDWRLDNYYHYKDYFKILKINFMKREISNQSKAGIMSIVKYAF